MKSSLLVEDIFSRPEGCLGSTFLTPGHEKRFEQRTSSGAPGHMHTHSKGEKRSIIKTNVSGSPVGCRFRSEQDIITSNKTKTTRKSNAALTMPVDTTVSGSVSPTIYLGETDCQQRNTQEFSSMKDKPNNVSDNTVYVQSLATVSTNGGSAAPMVPELGVRTRIFFKTSMCPWYARKRCYADENCNYAHSTEELRPKPDLHNTRLCPRLTSNAGMCDLPDCMFAHSKVELRDDVRVYLELRNTNNMQKMYKAGVVVAATGGYSAKTGGNINTNSSNVTTNIMSSNNNIDSGISTTVGRPYQHHSSHNNINNDHQHHHHLGRHKNYNHITIHGAAAHNNHHPLSPQSSANYHSTDQLVKTSKTGSSSESSGVSPRVSASVRGQTIDGLDNSVITKTSPGYVGNYSTSKNYCHYYNMNTRSSSNTTVTTITGCGSSCRYTTDDEQRSNMSPSENHMSDLSPDINIVAHNTKMKLDKRDLYEGTTCSCVTNKFINKKNNYNINNDKITNFGTYCQTQAVGCCSLYKDKGGKTICKPISCINRSSSGTHIGSNVEDLSSSYSSATSSIIDQPCNESRTSSMTTSNNKKLLIPKKVHNACNPSDGDFSSITREKKNTHNNISYRNIDDNNNYDDSFQLTQNNFRFNISKNNRQCCSEDERISMTETAVIHSHEESSSRSSSKISRRNSYSTPTTRRIPIPGGGYHPASSFAGSNSCCGATTTDTTTTPINKCTLNHNEHNMNLFVHQKSHTRHSSYDRHYHRFRSNGTKYNRFHNNSNNDQQVASSFAAALNEEAQCQWPINQLTTQGLNDDIIQQFFPGALDVYLRKISRLNGIHTALDILKGIVLFPIEVPFSSFFKYFNASDIFGAVPYHYRD